MKGTNTIIMSNEQILDILNQWWKDATYAHKTEDTITKVVANDYDGFVITMEEVVPAEKAA